MEVAEVTLVKAEAEDVERKGRELPKTFIGPSGTRYLFKSGRTLKVAGKSDIGFFRENQKFKVGKTIEVAKNEGEADELSRLRKELEAAKASENKLKSELDASREAAKKEKDEDEEELIESEEEMETPVKGARKK